MNNISIHSVSPRRLVSRITFIFRAGRLFQRALTSGIHTSGPATASSRIHTTLSTTRYSSVITGLPRNVGAVLNTNKTCLSNNRIRHMTLTHTVLGSTPVIILSRTATFTSPRGRTLVRHTFDGLTTNHAIVVVTRQLSAIIKTSGVIILGRNDIRRANARTRLLSRGNLCTGV